MKLANHGRVALALDVAWALGKKFSAVQREQPLPKVEGHEDAMFTIYWGEVSADSNGSVEMCKPLLESDAKALASHEA